VVEKSANTMSQKAPRFTAENGFVTTAATSAMMKAVRKKDSLPELILRRLLWKARIGYRLQADDLPGCPDIVIRKYKLAIFVDGDFWHGLNWPAKKEALKRNREFWVAKIENTIQRDAAISLILVRAGWKVVRFWEKQVRNNPDECLRQVYLMIHGEDDCLLYEDVID
jgi:DNA mismatch endonuclease, patch repair protein